MCYRVLLPVVMLSAGATALHAQAIIEYGLNAGRSGAAAGDHVLDPDVVLTRQLAPQVEPAVRIIMKRPDRAAHPLQRKGRSP